MRILFILLLLISAPAAASTYSIGVLAYNGKPQALARWQATAAFLTEKIANASFEIKPLTLEETINAINKQQIDFILTNPGHYVRLEVNFGVTRIVTFLNRYKEQTLKYFSAAIFTRSDSQIKTLQDLQGHSFAAVSKDAFGGFHLAQLALLNKGIDIVKQLDMIWLGFPHADIVKAVIEGRADAGIVRSGVIEKMIAEDKLDGSKIRILQQKKTPGYPFLHSVKLYPEWPFAKLPHTDTALAKNVAISLLEMPKNDIAAIHAGGSGWTIPLTYTSIHDVLRRLQVEPYPPRPMQLSTFWEAYQNWIIMLAFLLLIALFALVRLSRTNQLLQLTQQQLQKQQSELEETVQQRTDELLQINETLQIEISAHLQSEKTLQEGCESLKSLYSVLNRIDLDRQQKLNSMVESVRQYLDAEYALLTSVHSRFEGISIMSPVNSSISAPLSSELSQLAVQEQQIIWRENTDQWQKYICCPIFIQGDSHFLLEFSSSFQYLAENDSGEQRQNSELSKNILSLVSQWIGNETKLLQDEKQSRAQNDNIIQRFESLSPRETQVLSLLTRGESTKSMARMLDISTKTIEMHRANLLRKTNSKSSTELVQLAVISGLFDQTQ